MNSVHDTVIHSIYLAYYGRPADPAGLAFWSEQLTRADGRADAIIEVFANAPEATIRFADTSIAGRVTDVYRQLFDRAPDADGLHFWVDAIESGRTTLAAATLRMLDGARGDDALMVAARMQAAQAFTAAVAAGAADYSGYASIEAARALIAAVDADARPGEIAALVRLAVSLTDIAHDAPPVLGMLGVRGQLAPLFDLAAGRAEPGMLLELLTGLAGVAAAAPASLDALLKGGGVAGLLAALPRGVSLADLVTTFEQGGLRALASLVDPRPPAPQPQPQPEPEPEPEPPGVDFTLENGVLTVSGASVSPVLVDLSKRTIAWGDEQFPLDGAQLTQVVVTGYAGTVSLSGARAELAAVLPQSAGVGYQMVDVKGNLFTGAPGARVMTAEAALLAAASKVTIIGTLSLEESILLDAVPGLDPARLDADFDLLAPAAGQLRVVGLPPVADDADRLYINRDSFTLTVEGAEAGSTIRYQKAMQDYWVDLPDATQVGLADYGYMYRAFVIDAAGNISATDPLKVDIDTVAPTILSLAFGPNDGLLARDERVELTVVFDAPVTVAAGTVLHLNNGGRAVYQGGSGSGSDSATLVFAYTPAAGQSVTTLALAAQQALEGSILDRAGNPLAPEAFDSLTTAPAPAVDAIPPGPLGVALASDTGSRNDDRITSVGTLTVSGLETATGTRWEYRTDRDAVWHDGGRIEADGRASTVVTGDGARSVAVRQIDAAGNVGPDTRIEFTLDTTPPGLFFDHVEGWAGERNETILDRADVVYRYTGALDATDNVLVWINGFAIPQNAVIDTVAGTITLLDMNVANDPIIQIEVTDAAGNYNVSSSIKIDGLAGAPPLAVTPTAAGLEVTSTIDGTLYVGEGTEVSQMSAIGNVLAGQPLVIGARAGLVTGSVVLRTPSGDLHTAPGGEYQFDGNGGTTLVAGAAGGHLWGFGGNDTLLGGAGVDWLYGGTGVNHLTGGGGADRIDLTQGSNTVHFSAGDSNNGVFDTLVFDAGNPLEQWLDFDVPVSQVRSGTHFVNPADASPQALMNAFNAGFTGQAANPARGALIATFHNGETWMAVDTGNAVIDGNDYLIRLIGTVPRGEMVNGDGNILFPAS